MSTDESPTPAPAQRSFAERLFTPENVRILQSLGIGIIFISAIALVRNQMWSGATNLQRLGILIGGTAICYGIGSLLYRWTALKITGLGFLILGQLTIILDAYAALFLPEGGHLLYPYSAASLWTCTFILFTATAYFQARALKEPLFDAFTLFGGLGAWASGALWANVSPWLIPAAFVPAILFARTLATTMKIAREKKQTELGTFAAPRWSLEWWLRSCWVAGSHLLAAVLAGSAIYSSYLVNANGAQNELALKFVYHAAAIAALGIAMIAQRRSVLGTAYVGSLLLLMIAPLAAFAFEWPLDRMPLALSAPGAALLLAAFGTRALFWRETETEVHARCNAVSDWGLGAATLGGIWALGFYLVRPNPLVLWTALSSTFASVTYALVRRVPLGAWLATAAAGLLGLAVTERLGLSSDSVPLALIGSAAVLRLLWHLAGRKESLRETAQHGGLSTDSLAGCAGLGLLWISAPLLGFRLPLADFSLAFSWAAASAYVGLSGILNRGSTRRSLALGLLSPALACAMYTRTAAFGDPAPFLALLAIAVFGLELWWNYSKSVTPPGPPLNEGGENSGAFVSDKSNRHLERSHSAIMPGAAMVGFHALVLSCFQYATGHNASAAVAFALLASISVAASINMRLAKSAGAEWFEFASLGLISLTWLNVCEILGVSGAAWAPALTLLAGLMILLSLAAETLAGLVLHATHDGETAALASDDETQRPFRIAGEAVALLLSAITLEQLVLHGAGRPLAWFITNGGIAALLTAFIAVRPALTRKGEPTSSFAAITSLSGGIFTTLFFMIASIHAARANFWMPSCPAHLRDTCAIFFGGTLALSVVAGYWLRRAFAPVAGTLASLGLIGCAYGAFKLPVESFGLACALLAAGGTFISLRMRKCDDLLRSGLLWAMEFCAGSVALSAMFYMASGLSGWGPGPLHAYSVAGWLVLAGIMTLAAPGGLSSWRAFFAAISAAFAGCHLMRWMGLGFEEFGPALSACALLALAVRELIFLAPRDLEDSQAHSGGVSAAGAGLWLASLPLALAGISFGMWGASRGHEWQWCATLAESAMFLAAMSVSLRREKNFSTVFVLGSELGAWILLTMAVQVAAHASFVQITGANWALLGAILMALGMAAESAAGALLGSERHSRTPTPFMESRYVAAAGLALFGAMQALLVSGPLEKSHIDATWRALFGASVIAIYLSMSSWSLSAKWREFGRTAAAFAAYIVLIPVTYLCFLKAHSTGSSWGALWFMLLAPVMYGAVYVLEREKQELQAGMAKFGVAIVNIGALLLAYFGNRGHLAAVPAATFALVAMQAWCARNFLRAPELTWAACLASTGSVFYAMRAVFNFPAMGAAEPLAFEMPALAAWAMTLVTLGGALKLEEDETGTSRVAYFGGWLAIAATFDALLSLLFRGATMRTMPILHLVRVDALIACLLFGAGSAISARRWMRFELGKYLAPAATLIAYAMFILKDPVKDWEWITMPVALFLFLWARQQARDDERSEPEVSILLGLASSFALIPSFVQAMPYETAALWHAAVMLAAGFAMVMGAMFARRKIPLLAGSGAMLLLTLVKTLQWAAHRELFLPLVGIAVGFGILAMGSVFEARMNKLIRETLGRAKAEARMFWVSWN